MRKHGYSVLILGFMAVLQACVSPSKNSGNTLIPVEDFFKNPDKDQFTINPSGTALAFLQSYKNRMNVYIRLLPSKAEKQLTFDTVNNIRDFDWFNDTTLLIQRDSANDLSFHVYSLVTTSSQLKDLTPFPNTRSDFHILEKDQENIIIYNNKRRADVSDVYRLNMSTGKLTLIEENNDFSRQRLFDHNDQFRIAIATDGVNKIIKYRSNENSPFLPIMVADFKDSFEPVGFDAQNKNIYCISSIGRDKEALVLFDPERKKEIQVIYENPQHSVRYVTFSSISCKPMLVAYSDWKTRLVVLNDSLQSAFNTLEEEFPNYELSISSLDAKEDNYVVRTYDAESMGSYYLYNVRSKQIEKLGDRAPWLNENALAKVKPIRFKAADGLQLSGYLTIPRFKESKNLPLIVFPHSFFSSDNWSFSPIAQFFANRGYAVLQVNFRGSLGFGKAFAEAGYRQWGLKMQTDLDDGVRELIRQGVVDSSRVAIYGFDYGGFAALNALIQQPELYRCAIDLNGYTNLFTFLRDIPPYIKPYQEMIYKIIGHPEKDAAMFREVSPSFHIDKIKAPLLIAQGGKDHLINTKECDELVKDMQKRGIDVTYFYREDEGHFFRNEENKLAFFKEVERFLNKHMNAD